MSRGKLWQRAHLSRRARWGSRRIYDTDPRNPSFGWNWEAEQKQRQWMRLNALSYHEAFRDYPPVIDWTNANEVDPRASDDVFDQNGLGSCQGCACRGYMRRLYYLHTAGEEDFSCLQAYRISQDMDGITGDSGSTLSGGVKAMSQVGICRTNLWPYGSYNTQPKDGWREDAGHYKLKAWSVFDGGSSAEAWNQSLAWIREGRGLIIIGIMWPNSWGFGAGWESSGILPTYVYSMGGGHAILLCGVIEENGAPHLLLLNSWGLGWGVRGYGLVTQRCFQAMYEGAYNDFYGVCGLTTDRDPVFDF